MREPFPTAAAALPIINWVFPVFCFVSHGGDPSTHKNGVNFSYIYSFSFTYSYHGDSQTSLFISSSCCCSCMTANLVG